MTRKFQLITQSALCLVILFAAAIGQGQITPLQDAYTNTADPTTNYGAKTLLDVDGATQITYIQFNLASIPPGAVVGQATLKIYVNAVTTAGSFNVDYVNGSWTENTIDSSNAPALGSTVVSSVSITAADKNQYILVNVTSAVQAWLSGSQTNDGIALVANSTFNATFDSKENTTTSHPAELDIVFAGGGTITGVTTASGSGLTGGGTSGTLNLSLTPCAANQVLQYSGSAWACAAVGTGTVTSVASGLGLSGGPITGSGTLTINTSVVPQLGAANTFTGNQSVTGNFSATGSVSAGTSFNLGTNRFAFGSFANKNAFFGFAGNSSLSGTTDTAIGYGALAAVTSGGSNVAGGEFALENNTSGQYNTALGASALVNNVKGNNNTAVGIGSGPDSSSTNLTNATAIGANAVVSESNALVLGGTGQNAVEVGIGTATPAATLDVRGTANFTGNLTGTVIDATTGFNIQSSLFAWGLPAMDSIYLGFSSGNLGNNAGGANTSLGWNALNSTLDGGANTAIGADALNQNINGVDNTAVGAGALQLNTFGGGNTAIGFNAGTDASTPNLTSSTAIGEFSDVTTSNSLVLGSFAGSPFCVSRGGCPNTNVGIGTTAPISVLDVEANVPSGLGPAVTLTNNGGEGQVSLDFNTYTPSTTGTYNPAARLEAADNGNYSATVEFLANKSGAANNGLLQTMSIDSSGNVNITGRITKGSGSFKIDHPLDPANKYLSHSFVESPDMMNIYNGVTTLDAHGSAWIAMPDYFESLNRDFRYQLTSIGRPQPNLYIAREISGSRFRISGGKAGGRVSWQVTGIRHDAYADAHRIEVEESKPPEEQGRYLHPELFGAPQEQAIGYRSPAPSTDAAHSQVAANRKQAKQ